MSHLWITILKYANFSVEELCSFLTVDRRFSTALMVLSSRSYFYQRFATSTIPFFNNFGNLMLHRHRMFQGLCKPNRMKGERMPDYNKLTECLDDIVILRTTFPHQLPACFSDLFSHGSGTCLIKSICRSKETFDYISNSKIFLPFIRKCSEYSHHFIVTLYYICLVDRFQNGPNNYSEEVLQSIFVSCWENASE